MSEHKVILEINGRKVEVDDSFLSLPPEVQQQTVEQIASQLEASDGFMGQVNKGIAQVVGGTIDLVNPFDDPAWEDIAGGRLKMGSAEKGLEGAMRAIGARVATQEPEGFVEGMGRGIGQAAASFIPVAGALGKAKQAGGLTGAVADDVYRAMVSRGGATAEVAAGGVSAGASEAVRQAGGGEAAQMAAGVVAPVAALPAVATVGRRAAVGVDRAISKTPLAGIAYDATKRALIPMTDAGARSVVRKRMIELAGSKERAARLAEMIDEKDALGLTPAQQTGDPNMIGLERAVAGEAPEIGERLALRAQESRNRAIDTIREMGGDVRDARSYFNRRLSNFRSSMKKRVDRVVGKAEGELDSLRPGADEPSISADVVEKIRVELGENLARERELWGAVPKDEMVPVSKTAKTVNSIIDSTPWAQRNDIPEDLRQAFGQNGVIGDETTVRELYGLYSKMREVARNAMAGENRNANAARIAGKVADAILDDLGAIDASTEAGRAINDARAFSRALKETFDRGSVGRILRRRVTGGQDVPAEAALRRTVGKSGPEGMVAAREITAAAPEAGQDIDLFLRQKFLENAFGPDGKFTQRRAKTWLAANRDLLKDRPETRKALSRALSNREAAESFAARAEARLKSIEGGPVAGFVKGQPSKSVLSIIGADDPAAAARSVVRAARKDPGALAGVKAAFSDYLISQAGPDMNAKRLSALLKDREIRNAMQEVFTPSEMGRLGYIAKSLSKLETAGRDVGDAMNSPANRIIDIAVRIFAARRGGDLGGGSLGGSIQTANIMTQNAQRILRNMTNDRARKLVMDAVEDPELFKTLMSPVSSVVTDEKVARSLAPYLVGAASAQREE